MVKTLTFIVLLFANRAFGAGAFTFTDQPWMGNIVIPAGVDLTSGLVAYWSFDSATVSSGTNVTDQSGNNNTMNLYNSPSIVSGHRGDAVQFLAASSQYSIASNSASLGLYFNKPLAISCWVKFISAPGAGKYPFIVTKNTDFNAYGLYAQGDAGEVRALFGTGGTWAESSGWPIVTNVWMHLLAQTDGASTHLHLYTNGVECGTQVLNGGSPTTNTVNVQMGRHYSNPAAYGYLNAYVDELRIYTTNLTSTQISALAAQ